MAVGSIPVAPFPPSGLLVVHAQELGCLVGGGEQLVEDALVADPQQVANQIRSGDGCRRGCGLAHVLLVLAQPTGPPFARLVQELMQLGQLQAQLGASNVVVVVVAAIVVVGAGGLAGIGQRQLLRQWSRCAGRTGHLLIIGAIGARCVPIVGPTTVLLHVPQHAVLQGELPQADVALEGPLTRVGAHVATQILGGPEAAHAEGTDNLAVAVVRILATTPAIGGLIVRMHGRLLGHRLVRIGPLQRLVLDGTLGQQQGKLMGMGLLDVLQALQTLAKGALAAGRPKSPTGRTKASLQSSDAGCLQ